MNEAAARAVFARYLAGSRTAAPADLAPLAARVPPSDDPRIAVIHHALTGIADGRTGRPHAARHLETVLRLVAAHRLDEDPLYLECALTCLLTLRRPHEARPRFAAGIDRLTGDPAREARLRTMLGVGDAWAGDLRSGRDELIRARALATDLDVRAEATSFLIKCHALAGDLTASAAHLSEARELAARAGSTWVAPHIAECVAALHLARGDVEAWAGALEFLVGHGVGVVSGLLYEHRWELAGHHALRGDRERAAALLDGVADPPVGWPGAPVLPAWRAWIAAPADPGAMAVAESALSGLTRPLERLGRARLAWLLGAQHARLGRRADAVRLLETAYTGYAVLGAAGLAARVEADMARPPAAVPGEDPLTRTERRVATAVGDGLSNREVAARLSISVKTVEFHLVNIYRKLGVRNRTALARRT
ncbi:helix-turn-helix domain-containing protein [Catenuloplanes japonicus]|uniref:helix-turn-helix domain-containing protein n=1 Tax=Catenuloplanes japonicus TaxID=33876 RepID=UPI000527E18A|nr:helix-turn-helix transcriptional regulator [Catenuloplanes japonicus]